MLRAQVLSGKDINLNNLDNYQLTSLADYLNVRDLKQLTKKFDERTWKDLVVPAIYDDDKLVSFVSVPSKKVQLDHHSLVERLNSMLDRINQLMVQYSPTKVGNLVYSFMERKEPIGEMIPNDVYYARVSVGVSLFKWPTVFREERLIRMICANGAVVSEKDTWWSQSFSESAFNRYVNFANRAFILNQRVLSDLWKKLDVPANAYSLLKAYKIISKCQVAVAEDLKTNEFLEDMYAIWNKYQPVVDVPVEGLDKIEYALKKQPYSWQVLATLDSKRKYDVWNDATFAISRYEEKPYVELREVREMQVSLVSMFNDTDIYVPQLRS